MLVCVVMLVFQTKTDGKGIILKTERGEEGNRHPNPVAC